MSKETLGRRIAALADERGVGVKELADASGLSEGMIGKLRRGDRGTTYEAGLRIAKYLGVDPWALLSEGDESRSQESPAAETGSRLPAELRAWMELARERADALEERLSALETALKRPGREKGSREKQ